jgi:hypothetical protein
MAVINFVVAAVWGTVAAQITMQIWLALVSIPVWILGLGLGRANRQLIALRLVFNIIFAIGCLIAYKIGEFLVINFTTFGYREWENVVFIIVYILNVLFMLLQFPGKIVLFWRHATIPGSLEAVTRRSWV